ncbi:uncharacterized protein LACBIDRAFT_328589 [Laccaria bicolor S238N-H82]|uniref:Predicted protein n=1 Tax=Laccaria bicolor (strain S238N-H82 / ATCC MYA-4686) TaxID=486041 RepID=B0DFD1_LACBS|nr:uncharacterized protein LACBIDRAFT_328589 [Laccaria bicolor S238N-H82]EDR06845.1 predicted protein [Laccaria bicolor S238N-H82]|eukprot:XP_001882692.1 predicted protein [Laccaria bicolor S238N-H82]
MICSGEKYKLQAGYGIYRYKDPTEERQIDWAGSGPTKNQNRRGSHDPTHKALQGPSPSSATLGVRYGAPQHPVWEAVPQNGDAGSGGVAFVACRGETQTQTGFGRSSHPIRPGRKSCYPQETPLTKETRRVRGTRQMHPNRMFRFLLCALRTPRMMHDPLQAFNASVDQITHFGLVTVHPCDSVLSAQPHFRITKGCQPCNNPAPSSLLETAHTAHQGRIGMPLVWGGGAADVSLKRFVDEGMKSPGRRCPSCPLTTPNAGPLSQAFASNLRLRPTLVFCTSDVMTMKLDVIFPRARPEMPTISAAPLSGKGRPHHAIPAPPSYFRFLCDKLKLKILAILPLNPRGYKSRIGEVDHQTTHFSQVVVGYHCNGVLDPNLITNPLHLHRPLVEGPIGMEDLGRKDSIGGMIDEGGNLATPEAVTEFTTVVTRDACALHCRLHNGIWKTCFGEKQTTSSNKA